MATTTNAQTIGGLFLERAQVRQDVRAIHYVVDSNTITMSWGELAERVFLLTTALNQLDIGKGDRVAHWSENRLEWIVTDLALSCLAAVHVPIHATLSARQVVSQFVHCEPSLIIVSNDGLASKIQSLAADMPVGVPLVSYEPCQTRLPGKITLLSDCMAAADANHGRELAESTASQSQPDELTTILYTSGTAGESKGIMLSHRNLLSNALAVVDTFEHETEVELRLNFLPLSHIYARTCDVYTWLSRGSELALSQSRDTIVDDCKRFSPTLINGVPFFYERIRQKLVDAGKADQPGILKMLLGGKIRGCFCGGGALAEHTYDYYVNQQGVLLLQGYGMTESSPVITFSTPDAHRSGSAGIAIRGIELRISDDNEILTRGPHVMLGYWKDDNATRVAIQDGWLHTGDLGSMDDDGFLKITGRKTEMIVTSTGKNIFPSYIEELLCRDPLILQAIVVGDRRNCLAALIVPDPDVLRREIKKRWILVFRRKSAVRHPRVRELFRQRIQHRLADLAKHEQVPLFTILDRGFTPESGHMTAKLSLRRAKIEEDFAQEIEAMYQA